MPRQRVSARLAAALLSTLAIAPAPAGAATSGDPYDLHVVLPLTGSAGFLGSGEQQAFQIEQGVINAANGVGGRPVRFVFHDDQSSPQQAVQILNQVLAGSPKLVMGSALAAMCNAMAPRVKSGPVLYCLSPGIHPDKGSYVYTASISSQDALRLTLRYFRERGWTRIGVLTSTDASGQDIERGLQDAFALPENKSLQLVAPQRFNPSDLSVDAQIQRMKAANPQAIITWTSGTPLGTVFRGISAAGWDVPVAISNANMLYGQMAQYSGFTPGQLYIATADWLPGPAGDVPAPVRAQQDSMFAAFKAAGVKPDNAAGLVWDAGLIAVAALDKAQSSGGGGGGDAQDVLQHLRGFVGITGSYDFEAIPQRGTGESSAVMTTWDSAAATWHVVSHPGGAPFTGQ